MQQRSPEEWRCMRIDCPHGQPLLANGPMVLSVEWFDTSHRHTWIDCCSRECQETVFWGRVNPQAQAGPVVPPPLAAITAAAADATRGYATIQEAASACLDQLVKTEPPPWVEVLIQPQADGYTYVASGALELAIRHEGAKKQPPVAWASLRAELKAMQPSIGTRLIVEGMVRR